ncbi:uncharacterized protein K02A2.6-like [Ochlerotatus camptorhynchus]|uniref:uncharacterized protein K02A2.6-like n=1 Tax=Ochlerotatus camptorhynchus TaxID=644619 RepID=UPI0031E09742
MENNGQISRDVDQQQRFQNQQQQQQQQQLNLQQGAPVHQQQSVPAAPGQQQYALPPPQQQQMSQPDLGQMMFLMQQMMTQVIQVTQQNEANETRREARHQELIRTLAKSRERQVAYNPEQILDSLANNIKDFRYEPDSNITFAAWYTRYDELFEKDAARLDDQAKVRLLLRKLGPIEHERYVSFILPKLPKDFSFSQTVEKMKNLFGAKESVISRRYRCLQISRYPTEDHIAYACRVNKACVEFELGKLSEEQFKCLIYVCGLKSESDAEIRMRLLSKIEEVNDVTLEHLSNECQRLFNLKHDNAMIEAPVPFEQVNAIKYSNRQFKKRDFESPNQALSDSECKPDSPCWFCGGLHYVRNCGYKQHKCSECGQFGHREGYCGSANKARQPTMRRRKKHSVDSKVVIVDVCSVQQRRRFVPVSICGTSIQLQLDTASDITVISKQIWEKIGSPELVPSTVKAKTASGNTLLLEGEFVCNVTIGETTRNGVIRVTEKPLQLLGSDFVDSFDLWSVPMDNFCCNISASPASLSTLKSTFPKVFSCKLGLCIKTAVKFELKTSCKPVFCPKRPVAYAMYDAVNQELDRLEKLKIISPIDYSEWAAPIVVVRKANGAIRICGDYSTGLNSALQSNQYPLPLPEDIFAKLANCQVFSQIDFSDAFLQVPVDEKFRSLLTINTHRGLYLYNRLPPGVKIAPGVFQQLIDTMLADLPGTSGYLDDVVVGGENQQEHDRNLRAVLQRIQDFGFTIRAEKCSFGKRQIRYLGHIIDASGLRPDPAKVEAISKLPPPSDVSGVRSFLGAINYYGKFVSNMRALRYPLDNLLKTESKFDWNTQCQQAFDRFKQILTSDLLLTHFDPKKEIIVSADASSVGLGATISHKFSDGSIKVVQHASRALTKAEQNYSQPDREGLAIIFAVTKFHKMIFGRRFRLQTDHAPLVRIFGSKKGIPVYTANRLQRFALTLLLYDFDIEYVPTEKFGHADLLSRLISQHAKPEEDYIIASVTLEEDVRVVAQSTQADPLLRKVYRYIQNGWPQSKQWMGAFCFAERLVIPSKHQKRCLDQLHRGHPGMQRMKAIARSYVYWPSLDEDIVGYVKACAQCASVAKSPPHATPMPWPKTVGPWQRVHIDYAGPIDGDYFLIVVDSYSKWPEIVKTRSITSISTIAILRGLFARLGMPVTLVSDNGTQFTSAEFGKFCVTNGIEHLTTAPFHPQSNGQAERFVDTFKRAVKKIREGRGTMDEAIDTFLLTYRSTPNHSVPENKTPSEAMFGRKIRTSLELLRPPPAPMAVPEEQKEQKRRSFNRDDAVYAKVYTKNTWKWVPGIVLERIGNVMYNVWTDARMLRSHVNQLRSRNSTSSNAKLPVRQAVSSHSSFPLNVLMSAWNLPQSPSSLAPDELVQSSSSQASSSASTTNPMTPQSLPPSPRCSSPATTSTSMSSMSSTTATSTEFELAAETEPVEVLPRRSSRLRRQPRWFDPYQLY